MTKHRKAAGIVAATAGLAAGLVLFLTYTVDADAESSSRFRCEYRPVPDQRSRIDIDVSGLAPGAYSAEVTSNGGVNIAVSAAQQSINGTVDFRFESHEAGGSDTSIDPGFIKGLKASGRLVDSKGNTVFSASNVSCRKN